MNVIEKIRRSLEIGEGALITSQPGRFYLCGFNTSNGIVFISKEKAVFLTDFRYIEKARQTVKSCETGLLFDTYNQLMNLCRENDVKSLLTEIDSITVLQYEKYKKELTDIHISNDDRLTRILLDLRSVKTEDELENIRKAQKLTDETFSYILSRIEAGRTEREVMLDMEFYMRKLGSEGVAFDFIVVSGKNSSLPHGVPTDKKIENGDFVTMDFGAVRHGYCSDMTRTVAVGYASEEQVLVYNTVLKAQTAALSAIRSGVVCKDIDKIARDIIDHAGFEGCFGHGLGHSVGIEIHENPAFNTRCETVLKPNTVMTVEPGIYIENKFGVRIEDMVFITENGLENITKSQKELIIL